MRTQLWCALLLCAWPAVPQEPAGLVGERGQAAQQFSSAEIHFLRGENQKALEAYRKARELFAAAGDPLGQGHAGEGEADVLFRLGDDHGALDAYRGARELFLAAGDRLGQGGTWRGEAKVLSRLGESQQALAANETARQLLRAARELLTAGEQLRLGHTWYGEAEVLYRLSDQQVNEKARARPTQALYGYRKARQLYLAAGDKLGQGNTWRGEADVLRRAGENQKAFDAYKKARQLFVAVGDHEGEGDAWLGEAEAWKARTGKPKIDDFDLVSLFRAKKALEAAIADYQNAGDASKKIIALLLKAEVEAKEPAARAAAARGMANATAPNVGPFSLSVWYAGTKKPAARSAEEAIRLHGMWRVTGTTDEDRTKREEEIRSAYDVLVTFRARQKGQAAEALRLAEEARSRVLLDLLATPPSPGGRTPSTDLAAERQRLETEISQIEEQLRGSPPLEQQEALRVRRLQLELEWNAAQKKPFPQEAPLGTAAIQSLARETGPLLVYYVAESEVWGFLILPGTTEVYLRSIAISRSDLEQAIRDLGYGLANPGYERQAETQALRLCSLLIDPFTEQLPKSGPLVLVPHGPLHSLPFEALRDTAGKRLFERWQISIAPSVSALAFARSRHAAPLPGDSFLGFASGRGLNFPRDEVKRISGFFDSKQAADANYPNYVDRVAQARHLLIATRGVYVEESRSKTYLEIEPTSDHDSRLTAAEIAKVPLNAELVTLAACDTSYGKAMQSDERLDITRSFLIAGAAAVLATRWKLPEDTATSQFLADFYGAYRQGGPQGKGLRKDEALTEARRRSRERGDPAQVWAAWVLVGDAR